METAPRAVSQRSPEPHLICWQLWIIYDKPLGELFKIYSNLQLFAADAQIPFMVYLQAVIIISTSFIGAFMFVNGVDYYLENCKALYYTVNILHGKSLIRQYTEH